MQFHHLTILSLLSFTTTTVLATPGNQASNSTPNPQTITCTPPAGVVPLHTNPNHRSPMVQCKKHFTCDDEGNIVVDTSKMSPWVKAVLTVQESAVKACEGRCRPTGRRKQKKGTKDEEN
ncbi:hypothetical protein BU24DRAFT_475346 [Aaosphaeria arxii CBS 175.79]|uniref:Uncharacterized protein n=1 Tax=Aaosphaeria arxii CBS 175.79 TaxID=1450172 RepID=A0A6A5X621_9PLEO|nr:uncharacterized protein BU24DRAFT_475346 [Aaosphaeria arxii CBS 175.79]KAF2008455.1 hypothetical protein BU24DRAFT_475346 [Aaosphaeria arxii CBS 175.79]